MSIIVQQVTKVEITKDTNEQHHPFTFSSIVREDVSICQEFGGLQHRVHTSMVKMVIFHCNSIVKMGQLKPEIQVAPI